MVVVIMAQVTQGEMDTLDPYYESVMLLLSGNSIIKGNEHYPRFMTAYGSLSSSAIQSKFGGSSLYFNSGGSYNQGNFLYTPNTTGLDFTDDFTIEFWLYPLSFGASWGSYVLATYNTSQTASTGYSLMYGYGAAGYLNRMAFGVAGVEVQSNGAPALNTWSHFAAVRSGTTLMLFVNGIKQTATATFSGYVPCSTFNMGRSANNASTTGISGFIDDFRITNGVARYITDFTPPTAEFPWLAPMPVAVRGLSAGVGVAGFAPPEAMSSAGPITQVRLPQLGQRNIYFGGVGRITGTVKEKASPTNLPVHRRVVLIDEVTRYQVAETWSDATSGVYTFANLEPAFKYTVLAYDYTGAYRGVMADGQTPELMP